MEEQEYGWIELKRFFTSERTENVCQIIYVLWLKLVSIQRVLILRISEKYISSP